MGIGKLSRRSLIAGAAEAAIAAALPMRGLAQPQQAGDGESQQPNVGSGRALWMQDARYSWGVMTHYLADWQAHLNKLDMTVDQWNKMVDGFDAEGMAKRLRWWAQRTTSSASARTPVIIFRPTRCTTDSLESHRASARGVTLSPISISPCIDATSS